MMRRNEILVDYCQLCGADMGSPNCCRNLKKDFGLVKVDDFTDVRANIRKHMDANGYDTNKCDVCNVKSIGTATLFKFVHHSVPTMATEPFYRIEFIMEL